MDPSYLDLHESGLLAERIEQLRARLRDCNVCPRGCQVNRIENERGYCRSGRQALVCSYGPHFGEEKPISGDNGSGTIFFGNCNLHCVFCQNSDISHGIEYPEHYEVPSSRIARMMLALQDSYKCHNINLVSPSHFVPQIVEALQMAIPLGLHLPIVYNSNGYDDINTLQLLDGIIDIYMPDFKYFDPQLAESYSDAPDYPEWTRRALSEMYRQTGPLSLNDKGVARRGLMIRHLVLPAQWQDSIQILKWIAEHLSNQITISLLAQYHPAYKANNYPVLQTHLDMEEYRQVKNELHQLGFVNALMQ